MLDGNAPGRRVVADPQPPGRRGRVPRRPPRPRARRRPAQDAPVRPPGARAAAAPPRPPGATDDGVVLGYRCANSGMTLACAYRHVVDIVVRAPRRDDRRRGPRQDGRHGAHARGRRRCASPSSSRTTRRRACPAEELADRCHRTLDRAVADGRDTIVAEQREWLDDVLGQQRRRAARRRARPAGDALEPLPARPGERPDPGARHRRQGRHRRRLRGPLLLGHRDVRRAVPRLHEPRAGPQGPALPLAPAAPGPPAGGRAEPGRRAVPVAHDHRARRRRPTTPRARRSTTSTRRSPSPSSATSTPAATSPSSPARRPRSSSRRRGCGRTSGSTPPTARRSSASTA